MAKYLIEETLTAFLKYTPLLTVPEAVDLFKKAASLGFRPPGK